MNQILVTEKLYVTPELKRKKKLYKINFIVSIIVIIILCSFYLHSEYARNKDQELSQELLAELMEDDNMNEAEQEMVREQEEGIWKVIISSTTQAERQTQEQQQQNQNPVISAKSTKKKVATYVTYKGKRYPSVGRIQIPKIDVDYAILAETSVEWLRISPCKFWGPNINEIGNVSIAGHNYRNTRFFSKVPTLELGDKIKLTDVSGTTITYRIFDKYEVKPSDTDCINPISGKEYKRVVTLITCTNDSKKRVIIHAEEI